jgi:hypothetical protein
LVGGILGLWAGEVEVCGGQGVFFGDDYGFFDRMLEFADVAGPGVCI